MAKTVKKAPAKKTTKKATAAKSYNPHESPIIQAGIIFIIVSAIGITAFVFATYYQ